MSETLQRIADVSILAFVVSSMLVMGMSERLGDVVAPLKNPRMVTAALIVNFVAAPLLALLLSRVIPLQPAHAIGLLLLGGGAGTPFIPKLAEVAGGNLAFSVAIMVLLMFGSIVFMPVALLVLLFGPNLQAFYAMLGSFAIATYLLFLIALVLLGYAVGGTDPRTRGVFALASGQRNVAAALIVAVGGFKDPAVTVMVLMGAVVGLALMLGMARLLCTRLA